jgi:MFS family permease
MLTINLLDKDTVLPSLFSKMHANEILIGLVSVITIGLPKFSQIFFGKVLLNKSQRKRYVFFGFLLRAVTLAVMGFVLWQFYLFRICVRTALVLMFVLYTVYSLEAAYTSVGLVDLPPRSLFYTSLKRYYSLKQVVMSFAILIAVIIVRPLLHLLPYPMNYSILHYVAAFSLFIGAIGLGLIHEKVHISKYEFNLKQFFSFIYEELKSSKALLYFALIVNFEGLFLSIVPFFTTLAIKHFSFSTKLVASLLAWKIIGVLSAGSLLFLKKNFRYTRVLLLNILISVTLPIVLIFSRSMFLFKAAFFFIGLFNSFYRITYEGILVEISTHKNRAAYASVLGSSNIAASVVPLISGSLIQWIGYKFTFFLSSAILASSLIIVIKLMRLLKRA